MRFITMYDMSEGTGVMRTVNTSFIRFLIKVRTAPHTTLVDCSGFEQMFTVNETFEKLLERIRARDPLMPLVQFECLSEFAVNASAVCAIEPHLEHKSMACLKDGYRLALGMPRAKAEILFETAWGARAQRFH